jgi:lysophospholipase L1-like esterase
MFASHSIEWIITMNDEINGPKVVLCFGDSNTHGTPPMRKATDLDRFGFETRWPGVVQAQLGDAVRIIEEGHPGRTTVFDNPVAGGRKSALSVLPIILESHRPIDCIVLMLGTNDFQAHLSVGSWAIANNLRQIILEIRRLPCGPRQFVPPKIVLVSPPSVDERGFAKEAMHGAAAKSRALARHLEKLAAELELWFVDAANVVSPHELDGVHLDEQAHEDLGMELSSLLRKRLL